MTGSAKILPKTLPKTLPYTTRVDRVKFLQGFEKAFGKDKRFGAGGAERVLAFLDQIELDDDITDVRWAAYMLATTTWETTVLVSEERTATDRKGKVLLDKKGRPVRVRHKHWEHSMAPVDEMGYGKGRSYHEPVKVLLMPDGAAQVTEHDGDQFLVSKNGSFKTLRKNAKLGATDGAKAAKAYEDDDGDEQVYFGRGYVQLTWWSNYAAAGVVLGRGFDLLLDPELVKDPAIAYQIMSVGMRTGRIFANGHRLDHYFTASATNYVGARHMVNGRDHAQDIASMAEKFEKVLSAAGASTVQPVTIPPLH